MKSCFICPIYEKERDFNFAIDFYASKKRLGVEIELYYIFSNELHREHFESLFSKNFPDDDLLFLILPEKYEPYKSPVTVKKLYAVSQLYKKYQYIAVVDCECLFIKNLDIDKAFDEIWSTRSFMTANKSYLLQDIMKTCVEGAEMLDNSELKRETDDYLYNCWFNDIPVYNSKYNEGFFTWLLEKDIDRIMNDRKITDFYLYILYLYEKEGFRFKKINYWAPLGIMEEVAITHPNDADKIEKIIGTHWSSNKNTSNENAFILFHLDHKMNHSELRKYMFDSRLKYVGRRYLPWMIKIKNRLGV